MPPKIQSQLGALRPEMVVLGDSSSRCYAVTLLHHIPRVTSTNLLTNSPIEEPQISVCAAETLLETQQPLSE